MLEFKGYGEGFPIFDARRSCALSIVQHIYSAGFLPEFNPNWPQLKEEIRSRLNVNNPSQKISDEKVKIFYFATINQTNLNHQKIKCNNNAKRSFCFNFP